MKIDTLKFLFIYEQEEFKTLEKKAEDALINLLIFISQDEKIIDLRWAAYMLATVFHECAGTWRPIEEYGRGKGRRYGVPDTDGNVWYGRGYVQLTWKDNYRTMGKELGIELDKHPELALVPDLAYDIMSYGMRNGSFTGAGLKKYIHEDICDYKNARRIINGTDCADKIAGYAEKFERILKETIV